MRKLKTFVAVLMLVFVLGLAAPQALAGDMHTPGFTEPGEMQSPPGQTETPPGDTQGPGLATWASTIFLILGSVWYVASDDEIVIKGG